MKLFPVLETRHNPACVLREIDACMVESETSISDFTPQVVVTRLPNSVVEFGIAKMR